MIRLPNGCYCTGTPANPQRGTPDELPVYPKNWKKPCSVKKDWYIHFRFYDPRVRDTEGNIKPFRIVKKNMNYFKTYEERRDAVREIMSELIIQYKIEGYDPRKNEYRMDEPLMDSPIRPDTAFLEALQAALKRLEGVKGTLQDARSVVKYVSEGASRLGYDQLPIGKIRGMHLSQLLDSMKKRDGNWSNAKYNRYRSNLIMLFKILKKKLGAIEANYAEDIERKKKVRRIRETLSEEQRIKINQYLRENNPVFHRFVHIFFHSGARETEMMSIKVKDVNLKRQTYKCLVKKGVEYREVERTIKDIALPLWAEALQNGKPEDYLFSKGLLPGPLKIDSSQITRRWNRWIKKERKDHPEDFGQVTADFYSLKHSNTSETVDALDEQAAASQNGHTNTAMVIGIYDVKQKQRQHERLKKVNNEF